jgi:hypothetical protein
MSKAVDSTTPILSPDVVKVYADACDAKDRRIAELEGREWSRVAFQASPSRRAVLAGIAASAAALPVVAAAPAPTIHDPIFAAIELHRTTYAEYLRELYEDEELSDGSDKIADNAANALLATEPMTISGVAALLAYYSEQTIQDGTYFPDGAGEGKTVPFAAALTGLASRSLCRHASFSGGSSVGPASSTMPSIARNPGY